MVARLFWNSLPHAYDLDKVQLPGVTYRAGWPPRTDHRARMAAKKRARRAP